MRLLVKKKNAYSRYEAIFLRLLFIVIRDFQIKILYKKKTILYFYFFFTFPYYITLKGNVWLVTLKFLRYLRVKLNHIDNIEMPSV